MHKKRLKICTHYGVSTTKIYLYHSSKNASSRPPSGLSSEYNSVQSILVVLDLGNQSRVSQMIGSYFEAQLMGMISLM